MEKWRKTRQKRERNYTQRTAWVILQLKCEKKICERKNMILFLFLFFTDLRGYVIM